jgi:transposase InsO family protein
MTVYRILQPLIEKQEKAKSVRSPGWRGSRLAMKTRDGKDLSVDYSNHVWQCDHTPVDVLLVDQHGKILGRPWLTTVVDSYSRCIIGINLGYDAPSSQVVALALRHDIVNHYNQRIDARMGDQTRFQRWESGLIAVPDAISERDLDICLMKQTRRQIQRGGYLQFQ